MVRNQVVDTPRPRGPFESAFERSITICIRHFGNVCWYEVDWPFVELFW